MRDLLKTIGVVVCFLVLATQTSFAQDMAPLTDVLKKVDASICTKPGKLKELYHAKIVIFSDDKRVLPDNRVNDYISMLSDLTDLKCKTERKVLSGSVGDKVGYILVDEMISVTSGSTDTDERQHSVCSYTFLKDKGTWKISHEHCSSLPDYSIVPGDDALYYFHNPVY